MEEYTELSSKILAKNLEITKLTKQLDRCTSELLEAQEKIRLQNPKWMMETINNILKVLDDNDSLFADDEAKFDMLKKLTKIGKHLSTNGSVQQHTNTRK